MPEFNPDKHYYGTPCKHGHESGMRYRSTQACVTCVCEQGKRWRHENPEWRFERDRSYRASNYAWRISSVREWRARNPGYHTEYSRHWHKVNPHKRPEYGARRRSQKLNATPAWIDHEEVKYIYSLATKKGLVVDHIVPLKSETVCGLHCAENLRCIPEQLNSHKGNRYWPGMPDEGG